VKDEKIEKFEVFFGCFLGCGEVFVKKAGFVRGKCHMSGENSGNLSMKFKKIVENY
jgi:hypothetical protein